MNAPTQPGVRYNRSQGLRLAGTVERRKRVTVTVIGRHMEVTEALKTYAEQKANKLSKYYDLIQEIEVILDNTKDEVSVEMIVNAEHRNTFVAHHNDGDAYACIDGCSHKLERQITEHKKKFRNRKHPQDDTPKNVHRG